MLRGWKMNDFSWINKRLNWEDLTNEQMQQIKDEVRKKYANELNVNQEEKLKDGN